MKEKTEKLMAKKFKDEIQATKETMEKIVPQLEEFKNKYPKVGFMLCFGILDDDQHWVHSSIDMIPFLALNIFSDLMEQILQSKAK